MSEVLTYPGPATGAPDVADYLELLAVMSQDFAMSLDIDATLKTALGRIMDYLEAEGASIFLLENEDTELVCRVCVGEVDITGIRLGAGDGIVGRAVKENTSQMVRDVRHDPNFASSVDEQSGFITRSLLCAPLRVKEQPMGAIELVNKTTGDGLFNNTDRYVLQALAASASLAIKNAQMAADLLRQERLRREVELASEIQRGLLPVPRPAPFPVAGLNLPAREVSGDFYDFIELPDGRIAFNIGDVSGKGINAALMMMEVSSLFHCLGKTVHNPSELLAQINAEVAETATRGMFITMVCGIYDPSTRMVSLVNAGHEPPLLLTPAGEIQEFPASAPPVGLPPSLVPEIGYVEEHISLENSSLYLFTDGLTDSHTVDGRPYGIDEVRKSIVHAASLPLEVRLPAIVSGLDQTTPLKDDVTLLCIDGGDESSEQ